MSNDLIDAQRERKILTDERTYWKEVNTFFQEEALNQLYEIERRIEEIDQEINQILAGE
jgi:hypothetical protein